MSYSLLQNAKSAEILSPGEPVINRKNPAVQSLKRFGNMVGTGTAKAMNYANPLTFVKNVWNAAGRLPDKMKQYDRSYGDRVRADLAQPNPNHFFPTPFNNSPSQSGQSKYDGTGQSIYNGNSSSSPTIRNGKGITNAQVPKMRSDPTRPVNLKKYDYSTGQAFTPEQLDVHRSEQNWADVNKPSPYDGKQITPSNWRSPGKRYNDLDRSQLVYDDTGAAYFDNTYMAKRYAGSHKPRTEQQRVKEGLQAHNRVLKGTEALKNLNYYKQHGEDKPGYNPGYYNLNPNQKDQQQHFENELDVRKHALEIQKRNDSLQPDSVKDKFKPRYSDIVDDNFNITGSRFDGSFNESTGRWKPAGEEPLLLSQEQVKLLAAARRRSISDEDYIENYQQLLESLGLPEYWYEAYPDDEIGEE